MQTSRSRYAAFGIAFIGLLGAYAAQADTWLKDPSTGCTALSRDEDASQQTITWSGACKDGKASGTGVAVIYDNKGLLGVYNGEMVDGKLHGEGDLRFRDDETGDFYRYTGDFVNSKAEGDGVLSTKDWEYDGEFKDGEEEGDGTISYANGAVVRATFKAGEPVGSALVYYETKEGEIYFGEAENKKRHGQGTLIKVNDDVYIGQFEDGVASGPGTYDAVNGSQFVGFFANGKPNGFGTYVTQDGKTYYQGRFVNGKPEGQILVTQDDGAQTIETWKNGEKSK